MRHQIYLHLGWTTRDRAALIDCPLARFLSRILRALARKERSYILEIGMVQTHVHLLIRIRPTTCVASLVKRMKGASSALATQEGFAAPGGRLYWAKGYSVDSVSARALENIRQYLRDQPRHHPAEAILEWEGDIAAEYDSASVEAVIER
jgi:REP element-mobilizing transposase RayT